MCFGGPVTVAVLSAVAGQFVSKALAPDAPEPPAPAQVQKPPQAPKQPNEAASREGSSMGGGSVPGSAGSTLLTGGQGVSPSLLSLGKNTLLGA